MTTDEVQAWLDRYVSAWRSYDAGEISALFTEDATYAYHPWDTEEVLRGRDAIVANWLEDADNPGSWEASYTAQLVDGDRATATGRTTYTNGDAFWNLFVLRFDGDRVAEFTEWYMTAPPSPTLD